MIGQRTIYASQGVTKLVVKTIRGLPQGGVISPTMWALVADSLLKWLSKQGIYTQRFADDGIYCPDYWSFSIHTLRDYAKSVTWH